MKIQQTTGDDFMTKNLEISEAQEAQQVDGAPSQPCGKKHGVSQELLETVKVTVLVVGTFRQQTFRQLGGSLGPGIFCDHFRSRKDFGVKL